MTRHHHASGFLIRFSVALLVVAAFGEFSFAQQAGQVAETSSDSAPTTNTGDESSKPTEQASAKSESGDTKASESKSEEPPPIKIPPPPPQTGPRIPFELQRYEVELPIVFQPSAKLGPAVRESVIAELRGLIDRSVGPMWNLKIEEPRWIDRKSVV